MADQRVKDKLRKLLKDDRLGDRLDSKISLEFDLIKTENLKALKGATAAPVVVTMGGEGTPLIACHLGHYEQEEFLDVYGRLKSLYIRQGYDELYKDILTLWKTEGAKKVFLIGNAGTGKSWYQLYILRRLLRRSTDYQDDADDYDFVFRQVGQYYYLIDIKNCEVYMVNSLEVVLLGFLKRTLYFFEPGMEKEMSPTKCGLPSLATLSPYEKRIAEVKKFGSIRLYFWPWSFTEVCAIVEHSDLGIKIEDVCSRYYLYGGIIRHILAPAIAQGEIKTQLNDRLGNLDLSILQKKAANVDRDASGNNVSGFILCYDGKRIALEQKSKGGEPPYFKDRVLGYTSAFVEEKVEEILDSKPMEDKMTVVLERLNNPDRA